LSDGGAKQEAVSNHSDTSAHLTDNLPISKGPSGIQLSPAKLSRVQQTATRQEKKQTRKAQEGKLHVKRQEVDKAKVHIDTPLSAFFSL
jgi:SWI/SNF-related matrix-associated actin-dependent regulator of chromatin subfamily A member 5